MQNLEQQNHQRFTNLWKNCIGIELFLFLPPRSSLSDAVDDLVSISNRRRKNDRLIVAIPNFF